MERAKESRKLMVMGKVPISGEASNAHKASVREFGQLPHLHLHDVVQLSNAHELLQLSNAREVGHLSNARTVSVRELGQLSNARIVSVKDVRQIPNVPMVFVREDGSEARDSQDSDSPAPLRTWRGKTSFPEREEFMPDVITFKGSGDSFEEGGSDRKSVV